MRDVIEEIDALIAEEKTETDLVATIGGVTYRFELHGSVETFAGTYSFNEAAAKLVVTAMPGYEDEIAVDCVND